jgi:hypothetical protein
MNENDFQLRGYIYLAATRATDSFVIFTTKHLSARIEGLRELKLGPMDEAWFGF